MSECVLCVPVKYFKCANLESKIVFTTEAKAHGKRESAEINEMI